MFTRELDTIKSMELVFAGLIGQRLMYNELVFGISNKLNK